MSVKISRNQAGLFVALDYNTPIKSKASFITSTYEG